MTRARSRFLIEGYTQEVPSGSVNGSNTSFSLANTPDDPASVMIYLNGIKQKVTTDYSISGTTITMVVAPAIGQEITAEYNRRL